MGLYACKLTTKFERSLEQQTEGSEFVAAARLATAYAAVEVLAAASPAEAATAAQPAVGAAVTAEVFCLHLLSPLHQ